MTGAFANRSAIRVCQPGPEARHRSITSGGSRSEMSCRGLGERGRPPLFTTARDSISSVSSGSSLYSDGLMTCASTSFISEPEVGREAGLFTIIGLSHAEDVACCAALRVPDDDKSAAQASVADDPLLAVVLPDVLNFNGSALEDKPGIVEVESSLQQCLVALGLVEGDLHPVSVATLIWNCN